MKTYETVKCKCCGKEFSRYLKKHVFCSEKCKRDYRGANLDTVQTTCKGCGKTFTCKKKGGQPSRQYCCTSCQLSHTVPTKILQCIDCGESFEFRGRTTKLRCEVCGRKHASKLTMYSRVKKNPNVQIGIGSGGGQNKDLDLPREVAEDLNTSRRRYYRQNADRLRAVARSRYRDKALTKNSSCDICGYNKNHKALVVHHKNMDRMDSSEDNLAVLCANCHMILHKEIKRLQKTQQITAVDVYKLVKKEESRIKISEKTGEPPNGAIRPEGQQGC